MNSVIYFFVSIRIPEATSSRDTRYDTQNFTSGTKRGLIYKCLVWHGLCSRRTAGARFAPRLWHVGWQALLSSLPSWCQFIYEINCYFVHVVLSDFPLFRNHIDIILTTKNRPNLHAFQIWLEFIKIWQIFNHDSYPSDAWENDWDSGDGFTRAPCATVRPSPARQQAYSGSQVCMHGTRTHQFG